MENSTKIRILRHIAEVEGINPDDEDSIYHFLDYQGLLEGEGFDFDKEAIRERYSLNKNLSIPKNVAKKESNTKFKEF